MKVHDGINIICRTEKPLMSQPAKLLALKGDHVRAEAAPPPELRSATAEKPISEPAAPTTPAPKRGLRRVLMGGIVLATIVGSAVTYLRGGRTISTDNAYVQAGMLTVSPAVDGIVTRVAVTEGQEVKPGDLLFTLDTEPFRIAVDQAQAQVDAARLTVRQSQESYRRALFDITGAEAQLALDRQNFERASSLLSTAAVSRADFDAKKAAAEKSESGLASLRQNAAMILASLGGTADGPVDAQPNVAQAQSLFDKAQRDLRLSTVRATIAGGVAKVDLIQPGTRLTAGQPAFFVVGDRDVWIDANPKETDLTYLRVGAPAEITVDSYPGQVWRGHVSVISPASALSYSVLPAQNASGNWVKVVQRVSVRIAIEHQPSKPILRPGMSTQVEIDLGRARSFSDLWSGWLGGGQGQ